MLKLPPINGRSINGVANTGMEIQFNTDIFQDIKWYDELNTMGRNHKLVSTGHFLVTFLHEFWHVEHFGNIKKLHNNKMGVVLSKMHELTPSFNIDEFILDKYKFYPQRNFVKIFADVMTYKLAKNLDNITFLPSKNPISEILGNSSKEISKKERKFNCILKNIYNGDVDSLRKVDIRG